MKNYRKYILLLLALSPLFAACDKMLDVTPKDRLTPSDYFKDENELELYSNRFYNNILPGGATIYKEIGDNMIWTPLENEISCQRTVPEEGGGYTFTALRQVNFFLENVGNCPDKKAVAKYRGIAKFFRAYFYFEMVKRFGDVPWIDHVPASDDPDLYKPRDSREVVMDHILQDLDEAIVDLEKTKSKKNVYRVHWWTAQALKSRVGLFEGTFRKYHGLGNYEKYLNACVEASESFLSGGYSLGDSYREIFIANNASKEYIFARDYDRTIDLNNGVYNTFNSSGQGRASFTRKFINTYLMADGTRFTDQPGWKTMEFKDEIKNRDGRLVQTIRTGNGLNFSVCLTGYQPMKYIADEAFFSTEHAYNDLPLFRLPEMYLNYAEAKAELNTLTQDDLDISVNKLRERAGFQPAGFLNMATANANPDPYLCSAETGYGNLGALNTINKGVILEIRRERTIELVQESHQRYYDLMRWKEGQCITQDFEGIYIPAGKLNQAYDVDGDGNDDICVYNTPDRPSGVNVPTYIKLGGDGIKLNGNSGESGNMVFFSFLTRVWNEDRDYLYPIPNEDVVLTGGVVKQNPGW